MATRSHLIPAAGRFLFLELPLEIRRQIYDTTLGLSLSDQLSLLSTNHQIYDEGYNFVFRRPLTFSSRLRLQSFVNSHPPAVLSQVRSLRFRLGELAPSAMEIYLQNAIMGVPVRPSEHPYVLESESILSCLEMMPSIKHFSLLPLHPRNRSSTPRELVHYLLTQIPQHLQQLNSLSISTETRTLNFLLEMSRLRSLRFSGCYETDSQHARSIMKQMSSMEELAIIGPSPEFLKRQRCGLQKAAISAITPDVLCNMQPLKRLTIRDLSPSGNPTFLTRGMLMAIFDTHRTTLQSLCISSLWQPSTSVLNLLKARITSLPKLRNLQLEWPSMDIVFTQDYLSSNLQSLTVAVQSSTHAQDMIDGLTVASHRLPYLRDLHFNLIDVVGQTDLSDEKQRPTLRIPSQINTKCATSLWRITWGVWQPAGDDDS